VIGRPRAGCIQIDQSANFCGASPIMPGGFGGNCSPDQAFEDLNLNGVLDPGEDLNGNGILDATVNEDTNGNNVLDAGEDLNNNDVLDTALPITELADSPGLDCARPFLATHLPSLSMVDCDTLAIAFRNSCFACVLNGVLDPGEDLNGNGVLDAGEDRAPCAAAFASYGIDPSSSNPTQCLSIVTPFAMQCRQCVTDAQAGNFDYTNCSALAFGEFQCGNAGDGFGVVANLRQCDIDCDSNQVFGNCDTSEDANGNGTLDPAEDLNGNGVLDPGEDIDGDGFLDPAEDVNNNGLIDDPSPSALINGCETFLRIDVQHCGACGNRCVEALPNVRDNAATALCDANNDGMTGPDEFCVTCGRGQCQLPRSAQFRGMATMPPSTTPINPSYGNDLVCESTFQNCNAMSQDGCETNTANDANNCGGCAFTCAGGQTCNGGVCQ